MGNRISFSKKHLSLSEISSYYSDCEKALILYFSPKSVDFNDRFIGYTISEVEAKLRLRINELEQSTSFLILSSLEAQFRMDYLKRCYEKKKDNLSKAMRDIHQQKPNRASLEDDILKLWKQVYPEHKQVISSVISALQYRNWLAHGRYWDAKFGRKYSYPFLYNLAEEVEELLASIT
jgi:hypothetical protein